MTELRTNSTTRHGHTVREHLITVPLVHGDTADQRTIEVFAREYIPANGEHLPALLFLQGGPGHHAPRPIVNGDGATPNGWLGEALRHYRVFLFDQRGTGRSTPVDAAAPEALGATAAEQAEYLTHLRADNIVEDAELLRAALGEKPWTLLGQSFGGFCIATYLSFRPEGVAAAFVTGGLPGYVDVPHTGIDDIYRATYAKTAVRNERFYTKFPWAADQVAKICQHLDSTEEFLPNGERLSSRRFRTIGSNLGRTGGFDLLSYLLEDPFRGERLRTSFLVEVAGLLDLAANPLYAILHETIYAMDSATNWSAERLRTQIPGFGEDEYRYLTAEHFFPWHYEEVAALRPWREVAQILAAKDDWTPLYDAHQLHTTTVPTAAEIYVDDIFVPFELSMQTANAIHGMRPHITNRWEHNGIHINGAEIFRHLRALVHDH